MLYGYTFRHSDDSLGKEKSFSPTSSVAMCATPCTSGCWTTFGSDSEEEGKKEGESAADAYHKAMGILYALAHGEN